MKSELAFEFRRYLTCRHAPLNVIHQSGEIAEPYITSLQSSPTCSLYGMWLLRLRRGLHIVRMDMGRSANNLCAFLLADLMENQQ